jgi:hypothetical protein
MTLHMNAGAHSPAKNALLGSAHAHPRTEQARPVLSHTAQAKLLRSTIGHAAVLSDTPEKWAATLALLKGHGVNPEGYEDFDKGRSLAISASGVAPEPEEGEQQ